MADSELPLRYHEAIDAYNDKDKAVFRITDEAVVEVQFQDKYECWSEFAFYREDMAAIVELFSGALKEGLGHPF